MAITTENALISALGMPSYFYASSGSVKANYPSNIGSYLVTPTKFTPATPGLTGSIIDGTASTTGGFFPYKNPSAGNMYFAKTDMFPTGATLQGLVFYDFLLYNTGIVVTTTTIQTVNSVALPARDATGATNGVSVHAWLLCTAANTNSGVITNTSISYTNSSGTTGRTGTLAVGGWPATASVGTMVPFSLQAGDIGVRSIQSITLGTSYVAGSISLILIRELSSLGFIIPLTGYKIGWSELGLPILYNGTAISFYTVPFSTTAFSLSGSISFANG
jgi:hypothetical protein